MIFQNGVPVRESDRVQILRSGPLRKLTITDMTAVDSGEYMCQTSDERSHTRTRVHVDQETAHVHLSPQDQVIKSTGEKVQLRCELTQPVASAKWYKNGLEVWEMSGKHFAINEDKVVTLEIINFDERDVGDYYLELPNGEKSAQAHIRLKVSMQHLIQTHSLDSSKSRAIT